MTTRRLRYVGFAALSWALLVLLPSSGHASTGSDDSSSLGCIPRFFGDGDCDLANDTEDCGYDSGDCCECTCVSTEKYTCGESGGYFCVDPGASCVDDDDVTAISSSPGSCVEDFVADGDCDAANNYEGCGYDGGDCCECTCVSTEEFTCGDGNHGGFACVDPSAPCREEEKEEEEEEEDDDGRFGDDNDDFESYGNMFSYALCRDVYMGDGDCDAENNKEKCGYDGGDCCECDCVSNFISTCGENADFDCIDPTSTCFNGYVEAGTKTTVGVTASGYDARPGQASGENGCMVGGCVPGLTRDGITDVEAESRWSCASKLVPGGGQCWIEFAFESPQDVMEMEVAFFKGEERSRTLEATINGEVLGSFDSYPGSTFNVFGVEVNGVHTLTLTSVGLEEDGWISFLEVRFLVKP